jgi:acyl-coenzyme A synthetase/AMP-(fatty) acid ligase
MGTSFGRRRIGLSTPKERGTPRFNFTRDVVEPLAADGRYRTALVSVDEHGVIDRRTFTEVAGDANRWAGLFHNRLVGRGDRIIVRLPPGTAWAGVILGALKAGVVVVPCSPGDDDAVVTERARETDARLIVAREEHLSPAVLGMIPDAVVADQVSGELNALPSVRPTVDTHEGGVAFILYTAGTTNAPLGAVHTHAATAAARPEHWLDARADDVVWSPADTNRPNAIWDMLAAWAGSATVVLHEHATELSGEARLELIERLGVTILSQTPNEYRAMLEDPQAQFVGLPTVRRALSTGATLDRELVESFRATFGVTIHDCYSQAESLVLVANLSDDEFGAGSIGVPVGDNRVAVIDATGAECRPGVEGDLAVLGDPPTLFHGYWREPAATEVALRGFWYLTGDRAVVDEDGYFWLAGRSAEADRRAAAAERERAGAAEAGTLAAAEARELAEVEARARAEAEALARAAAEEQARVEAEERARRKAEERARADDARARAAAEERARRDAEEQTRRVALAKAHAEQEKTARSQADARAREEAAARGAAEAEARAEAEAKARSEAEARAQARAEKRSRKEAEAQAKARAREEAQASARERAEAKARAKADAEARRQAEADAKAKAKAEAETMRKQAQADAKAQAEADAKARERAEAEAAKARKQAEADAKAQAEAEAKARKQAEAEAAKARKQAEADAKAQAEAEAKARKRADAEAKARAEAEEKARAREEAEARDRERHEAKARAKEEARARKAAEARARAEAKARKDAEARARKQGVRGNGAKHDAPEPEQEDELNVELYERLRAYGRSGSEPPDT